MPTKRLAKKMRVPYALAVHGEEEERAVLSVLREKKTILGDKTRKFEEKVSRIFGKRFGVAVNSGSSANLISIELLGLPAGSEVITPVLTFSTTVAPLLQKRLKPKFIDVEEGTYLVNHASIAENLDSNTKCLLIPNLLGNIPNLMEIKKLAEERNIPYVEDSCDTIGGTYAGKPTGTFSDISTTSFYGSHVITAAGGGGMLCFNDPDWYRRARVIRSWGRSSAVDENQSLKERFSVTVDGIDYDSKFVFEEIGYNLLPLEIQSAFGLEQIKKLARFSQIRANNFRTLYKFFGRYKDLFVLPRQREDVKTAWLAFPLTIKDESRLKRKELVMFLETKNIQTRPVFTGNVTRQPAFCNLGRKEFRSRFPVADTIMRNSFVVGINQGLTKEHMDYMVGVFEQFLDNH